MTLGISPKVKLPAIALFAIGVILTAIGLFVRGAENVKEPGITMIAASGIHLPIGFLANPGNVVQNVGVSSDTKMTTEAMERARASATPTVEEE